MTTATVPLRATAAAVGALALAALAGCAAERETDAGTPSAAPP